MKEFKKISSFQLTNIIPCNQQKDCETLKCECEPLIEAIINQRPIDNHIPKINDIVTDLRDLLIQWVLELCQMAMTWVVSFSCNVNVPFSKEFLCGVHFSNVKKRVPFCKPQILSTNVSYVKQYVKQCYRKFCEALFWEAMFQKMLWSNILSSEAALWKRSQVLLL